MIIWTYKKKLYEVSLDNTVKAGNWLKIIKKYDKNIKLKKLEINIFIKKK